jgi:GNAT superfamily N-acetyltransferase
VVEITTPGQLKGVWAHIATWATNNKFRASGAFQYLESASSVSPIGYNGLLYVDGGVVQGIATVTLVKNNIKVIDLASDGVTRGIGTRLIHHIVATAAKLGKGVTLEAATSAAGFYEKLGFAPSKREKNIYTLSPEAVLHFRT